MNSPTMIWDFWSRLPESLHQVTILFSDLGTPDGYRTNESFCVKWFFKTKQGIKNVTRERAAFDPKNIAPGMEFSTGASSLRSLLGSVAITD
jgi:catalase